MLRELSELQKHFGDRFEGSTLVSVDELFWPVFCHSFSYSVRTTSPLNPIEEGLLRIVSAGVKDITEASRFLGAGQKYVEYLAKRLSETEEGHLEAPMCWKEGCLGVTASSEKALADCTKQELEERELSRYRDGIFGTWLKCGDDELDILAKPDLRRAPGRWLAARESYICSKQDHAFREQEARSEVAGSNEVVTSSLAKEGVLRWISLSIACYQSTDGKGGTFLLFNPGQDDKPLEDLSTSRLRKKSR